MEAVLTRRDLMYDRDISQGKRIAKMLKSCDSILFKKVPTISGLITAMTRALEHIPPMCSVDMSTFGVLRVGSRKTYCFGCAAAYTLMRMLRLDPVTYVTWRDDRTAVFEESRSEISLFENTIDELRIGAIRPVIFGYMPTAAQRKAVSRLISDDFGSESSTILRWTDFALRTDDYEDKLPNWKRLASKLRKAGF